ncbi:unnamed protein product [Nesidiocoris tenuis]|uniref:Homeobox domain-containing protein n=1 Tax=Nesidiocoris tenuis TaxID=355587 RepID=A0A6H5HHW9_9HEMI|nr:unnamed protein product [Nesidiocoris tenuis]
MFRGNPYGLKDASGAGDMSPWASGLQPSSGYYPYDPTLAAYGRLNLIFILCDSSASKVQVDCSISGLLKFMDANTCTIEQRGATDIFWHLQLILHQSSVQRGILETTIPIHVSEGDMEQVTIWQRGGKNATRESTATLKAWLNEHKKNPYPTKGEKIMLAIITKMTLTQVSTWFANARRRLKKENKMTWEPKNKTDDDDDAVLSDSEDKDKDDDDEKIKDPHRMEITVFGISKFYGNFLKNRTSAQRARRFRRHERREQRRLVERHVSPGAARAPSAPATRAPYAGAAARPPPGTARPPYDVEGEISLMSVDLKFKKKCKYDRY